VLKDFLKRPGVQRFLSWLIAGYSGFVFRTTRWTYVDYEAFRQLGVQKRPLIACFWHGRMILMPNFWPFAMPLYVLHSPHRDGQLMLRTLARFGMRPIIGSSKRGGAQALRDMSRVIREGSSVCITPDGPRGPRMRVSAGIVLLAKLTGAPLVPASFSVARGRTLDSWDRLLIAHPFGRGVFISGEPVFVARDADHAALEKARATLERRLNTITAEADRRCGRAPVAPAEAPASAATEEPA
jgi:hypothetical protein